MGFPTEEAKHTTDMFLEHDERYLRQQSAYFQDEKQLIQTAKVAAAQLASIMRTETDRDSEAQPGEPDEAARGAEPS